MKTLSTLASAILPLLTTPLSFSGIVIAYAKAYPQAAAITPTTFDDAIDELNPALVTCDEHEGVPYFYRRDLAAEKVRMGHYADAVRVATHARDMALALVHADFAAAVEAAEEERDAADPMAAIKATVPS